MRRILLLASTDLTHDQRMIRISRALAARGFSICLIGRRLHTSVPLKEEPYEQLRLPCYFQRGKAFYLEFNLRLFWHLLRAPFDAVCAADLDTLAPAVLAAKIRNKRVVYDAHEYFSETPELQGRPFVKKCWEKLADWAIPKTDRRYTVGPELARRLGQRYRKPFGVVRNMPFQSPAPDQTSTRPILLYQGALNIGRGLEQVLSALALLPECTLWLAGEGDLSQTLRRQVQEQGLQDRVRFMGRLSPEALRDTTPHARIGLNLLENNSLSYYYSLANKAFDYVQAGLPSLQMDFPEYRRLNAQHECFVLLGDISPHTIAEAVHQLLHDDVRYQQLHLHCKAAAQEWNWERETENLYLQYDALF